MMSKSLVLLIILGWLNLPNLDKAQLVLEVKGSHECNGTVWFTICDNESEFEDEHGGKLHSATIANGRMRVIMDDMVPGFYAIKLFVDKNHNSVLDQGLFGIPKEPYGFSNNAIGAFGPPKFEEARFHLEAGGSHEQVIELRGI